jgi:hypothetical protein
MTPRHERPRRRYALVGGGQQSFKINNTLKSCTVSKLEYISVSRDVNCKLVFLFDGEPGLLDDSSVSCISLYI